MAMETVRMSVEGMDFSYVDGKPVLEDIMMDLRQSEILGIVGPNGSGKTTLIKCLNRILTPLQGEILLNGEDLRNMRRVEIAKEVSYVPQSASNDIVSPNVYDVVMMGRRPHTSWGYTEKDDEIVWKAMMDLDVAHLASHGFDELSSGQTQRVLIARAIAQEAKIFLLDEPTSNLDIKYQLDVMNLVRGIVTSKKMSACAIVHDLDLAMRFCDRAVLLCDGKVLKHGPTADVLTPELILEAYGVRISVEHLCGRNRIIVI